MIQAIRGEYLDIPRLHLTRRQIQSLWGLDPRACDEILGSLTAARFLRQAPDGGFIRADDDSRGGGY